MAAMAATPLTTRRMLWNGSAAWSDGGTKHDPCTSREDQAIPTPQNTERCSDHQAKAGPSTIAAPVPRSFHEQKRVNTQTPCQRKARNQPMVINVKEPVQATPGCCSRGDVVRTTTPPSDA